jgi:2'-5' RNA ligase
MSPSLIPNVANLVRPEAPRRGYSKAWFEDDGPPPLPSDPVLLLLYPPQGSARQITGIGSKVCDQYNLPGQRTETDRLHATVHFPCRFGRLSVTALAEIDDAVASLTMPPFLVGWSSVGSFGNGRPGPLVLLGDEGVVGVTMLRNELVTSMRMVGFRCGKRDFTPHVTLNYEHGSVPLKHIDEIRWTVRELVLVCSLWGHHRHRVMRRWQLRAPCLAN